VKHPVKNARSAAGNPARLRVQTTGAVSICVTDQGV